MEITYTTANVLDDIKRRPDCHYHTIFSDPPYQLSTVWDIDRNTGRYVVRGKASDFMNKWEGLDHNFLEVYFQEAFRVLKYGGYALHYCVARQSAPLIYYAKLAGFETECQPLHWYFISNFPKGTDAGKAIDKRLGAEREVVGVNEELKRKTPRGQSGMLRFGGLPTLEALIEYAKTDRPLPNGRSSKATLERTQDGRMHDLTAPATPLAQTFDGWKYGRAPLKATSEKILVFRKPTKGGSVLDDLMACMDDPEISPACLNIEGGRVPTEENVLSHHSSKDSPQGIYPGTAKDYKGKREYSTSTGRYPSDLFLDAGTAEMIDKQSGESTSREGIRGGTSPAPMSWGESRKDGNNLSGHSDSGGASRINHIIGYEYEEHEQFIYCPKVSDGERQAGTGGTNPHPTLKPIALNIKIATLFKLPDECEQIAYIPFCGTGSEGIGAYKAGITRLDLVDIDPENIALAKARFAYWKDRSPDHKPTKGKDPGDLPGQMELF